MNLLNFAASIILLTASGALAPGPLFIFTVSKGATKGARVGLYFSIAHALVEFIVIIFLGLGILSITDKSTVRFISGLSGGIVLILFGALQIRSSFRTLSTEVFPGEKSPRNLVFLGFVLTGLNPFFIVWWLTVGPNLVLMAMEFASFIGIILMFLFHVWIDFFFLILVAYMSKKGVKMFGLRVFRVLLMTFGFVVILYGIGFIINSLGFNIVLT